MDQPSSQRKPLIASMLVLSASLAAWPGASHADTGACLKSYEQAQRFRNRNQLLSARKELLVCASDSCPTSLRTECLQWADELERALPSVVVSVEGADGRGIVDVRVSLDGKPWIERADGKPVAVDPGVHTIVFELPGGKTATQEVVVRAGEKNQPITLRLSGGAPASSTALPTAASVVPPARGPVPVASWVLGGIGVVGLGAFAYFGLSFDASVSELESCRPGCAQTELDHSESLRRAALISLGIGVASSGAALVLYLTRPDVQPVKGAATGRAALRLFPAPTGGAMLGYSATF